MDLERALAKVDEYIGWCEKSAELQDPRLRRTTDRSYVDNPEWVELDRKIKEGLPLIERIAKEVDPRLVSELRKPDAVISHHYKLNASRELRGAIASKQEADEIMGPQGPKLAAASLHEWVWEPAARLWSDGHRRSAVQAAATALYDVRVPAKLGRERDTRGGVDLMGQAFSTKSPEPGAPRLRLTYVRDGTPEWTSAHEGAMKLGQGAAQAIRNLSTHNLSEPDEQEGLEMLAVLSYVARLVDRAEVTKAP